MRGRCAFPVRMKILAAITFLAFAVSAAGQLRVAALHPMIGSLVREVGGTNVEVVDLLKPGGDAHHFEPSAQDIAAMKGVRIVFASGKNAESYLDNLADTLGPGVKIVEAGKVVASIKLDATTMAMMEAEEREEEHEHHEHEREHDHSHGGIDPHWWHSADGMARAARCIGEELAEANPANATTYKAGADAAQKKIGTLRSWAMLQIAQIPRADRKLVTAHAAFGYFCKEFGFKSLPLLGLGREDEATAKYLTEAIATIRREHIKAIFPEDQANPKIIQQIVRDTGVRIGGELIADGTAPGFTTYEAMLKHNVEAIVNALK